MSGYLNPQMAFMEHLDGSFLFDSMYSEDVEGNKLSYLPGVGELLETYPFWVTAASSGAGLVQVLPACLGQVHLTLYLSFPIIHVRPQSLNLCWLHVCKKPFQLHQLSFVGQRCPDFCRHIV